MCFGWAFIEPKHGLARKAYERDFVRRREIIERWSVHGVHGAPAGVGAGEYLAKTVGELSAHERWLLARGTGIEMTNPSNAKMSPNGSVSATGALLAIGEAYAAVPVGPSCWGCPRWSSAQGAGLDR